LRIASGTIALRSIHGELCQRAHTLIMRRAMDDVTLGFGEHSCTYAGEAKLPLSAAWPTAPPSE
jgi:hypothetical protein